MLNWKKYFKKISKVQYDDDSKEKSINNSFENKEKLVIRLQYNNSCPRNNNINSINNENNNYTDPPKKIKNNPKDNEVGVDYNQYYSKVNIPKFKITNKDNEEYSFGNDIELIPREYSHFFFEIKDNGVVKEINRKKLPFKIDPKTKYLFESIPGTTYGDKFNIDDVTKNNDKENDINKNVKLEKVF